MTLRESLPHAWVTIGVPGTDHAFGTYVAYPADRLPPVPPAVSDGDGFGWLRELPTIGRGMTAGEHDFSTTPCSREGVEGLLRAGDVRTAFDHLPRDLRAFATDPDLHRRLFSATDAYVDAGEHLEPVRGGHLLHLVSDSQWVVHWLAYLGDDGSTGVVCTPDPLGYADDEDAPPGDEDESTWVADSVAEFVWRWWADNYAFSVAHPDVSPTLRAPDWFDVAAYTAGYGPG